MPFQNLEIKRYREVWNGKVNRSLGHGGIRVAASSPKF